MEPPMAWRSSLLRLCASPAQPRLPQPAELLDLRAKFEADKRRIAELRASRKWKPY
jgi:hypothetical protein